MKQIGFLFSKEAVDKYELNLNECYILNWFINNKPKDTIQVGEKMYNWVKYDLAIKETENYTKFHNRITIAKIFNSLCEKKVLLKYDSGKNHVRKLYFSFCDGVKEELLQK